MGAMKVVQRVAQMVAWMVGRWVVASAEMSAAWRADEKAGW